MAGDPKIDWSQYQQPSAAPAIDFSKYVSGADASSYAPILQKYGLPETVDLRKSFFEQSANMKEVDPIAFSKAYSEANPPPPEAQGFLANMWGEAKNIVKSAFSEGKGVASMPSIPVVDTAVGLAETGKARYEQAKTDPLGAFGKTATDISIAALPFIDYGGLWRRVSPATSVEQALGRKLSLAEADTPRPGGQIQPALNNTPREVLQHAKDEGINLTPGQATEDAMAQNLQKAGSTAAVGGKELSSSLKENQTIFGESVNNFMEKVDPSRSGLSAEQAGESVQDMARAALQTRQGKALAAYNDVRATQQNLRGDLSPLLSLTERPKGEYQSPAVRLAIDDIEDAAPPGSRVGAKPTIQSMRNLRTEFMDKANDYTGNIPDAARAIYKQAAGVVDNQIMEAARGTPFEGQFRNASALWKDTQQKFNEPGTPLYKILQSKDPVKTITMLENAPATDIETLKNEAPQMLEPLRRQVIQDIARSRFNIGHDGLGGYSDAYLKTLFDSADVKELYLKGDLANRLKYDPNPSGTGANISSLSQLGFFNQAKMSAAAKMSMPRDPMSFLPPKQAIRTTPFTVPSTAVSPSDTNSVRMAQ